MSELIASDLHLRDRRGDEYFAWDQVVEQAIARDVSRLIITGDILDKQSNRPRSVAALCRGIEALDQSEIEVCYLSGQHDLDEPAWPSAHPSAVHIHKVSFVSSLGPAYGLDYQPAGRLQEELAEIPQDRRVLFCHQGWAAWLNFDGAAQGEFADIPGHIEVVVTGDLHQSKIEQHLNAAGREMMTISPGATTQQKSDEPSEHFCLLVKDDGRITRLPLKSRKFMDWDVIETDDDLAGVLSCAAPALEAAYQQAAAGEYPDYMMKPVVRVTYASTLPETVRRIIAAVGDKAYLVWKELPPEDKRPGGTVVSVPGPGEAVTLQSALPDELDKDKEPAVYGLVERLLTAGPNAEAELTLWRQEALVEETSECGSSESP